LRNSQALNDAAPKILAAPIADIGYAFSRPMWRDARGRPRLRQQMEEWMEKSRSVISSPPRLDWTLASMRQPIISPATAG
jgi:hypothetical protein